jgi:signal peptidase I
MEPTLFSGEYIIVDKISYRFTPPKRGDVVVLNPDSKMPDLSYIKRIIGLPGEKVIIENGIVKIVSGDKEEVLREPYLGHNNKTYTNTFQDRLVVNLGENEYFVSYYW